MYWKQTWGKNMVGGKVIGIVRKQTETLLNVEERKGPVIEGQKYTQCAVNVIERTVKGNQPIQINLEDEVWWQCGKVLWTPHKEEHSDDGICGVDYDIAIPKVGYSH